METGKVKAKVVRLRSPNYPSLTLEKSLVLVEILLKNHSRYQVALEVVAKDWGVSPASSYLAQHIAALVAYGLIETEGEKDSKKIKVSELAYKILMDKRPDSLDRKVLIREAVLKPGIIKKIFDTYPSGLPADPDDHALEYELTTNHKFNPASVKDFIALFKKNMDFAGIYKSGIINGEKPLLKEPDMEAIKENNLIKDQQSAKIPSPTIPRPNERKIAEYPVGRGLWAKIIVSGESPFTMESIKKLITLVELTKEDIIENLPNATEKPSENY